MMTGTRTLAPRRTIAAALAAGLVAAAAVLGVAAPAHAAVATKTDADGRKMTSVAGTAAISTVYAEGSIAPVKLEKVSGAGSSVSLNGRVYWTLGGDQFATVATTNNSGWVYIPDKPFPPTLSPGTHAIQMIYCAKQSMPDKTCPTNVADVADQTKLVKLNNVIKVAKIAPQITISLSRKLVKLDDIKSGAKSIELYAYVSGAGLKSTEADLKGNMRVFINDKDVTGTIAVKPIAIPGTSTKKPAIKLVLPKSRFTKVGVYKVRVEYNPGAPSTTFAQKSQSQFRSIQIVAE